MWTFTRLAFFFIFSLQTIEWVKRQQSKREFSVWFLFFLFEAKTNSADGRKTLWLWEDVTTRRDFFLFTFFLRPSPLMPFCYSKVVVFPRRLLLNYSSYFYTASYNIQQQPTHKHLKDTPTRWPYALLCGYLYQNGTLSRPSSIYWTE